MAPSPKALQGQFQSTATQSTSYVEPTQEHVDITTLYPALKNGSTPDPIDIYIEFLHRGQDPQEGAQILSSLKERGFYEQKSFELLRSEIEQILNPPQPSFLERVFG